MRQLKSSEWLVLRLRDQWAQLTEEFLGRCSTVQSFFVAPNPGFATLSLSLSLSLLLLLLLMMMFVALNLNPKKHQTGRMKNSGEDSRDTSWGM